MLLLRSNISKLFVLFTLLTCTLSQHYDGEYDDDDHSSYESESDGPDYSKYYSGADGGSSAALIDVKQNSGFVNPADFSSFFSPSFYAASNKQEVTKDSPAIGFVNSQDFQSGFADFKASPFGGKDFFEQAQLVHAQQQNAQKNVAESNSDYEIKPGPSYVSHKIVPPATKKSKYETSSELDDLNKPYNYKISENDDKVIPLYSGNKQKVVEQNKKFVPHYTPKNQNNLTPYQKYSFQTQTQPATLSTFASAATGKLTLPPTPSYANYDYLYTPSTNNDYKLAYDAAATNVNSKLQDFNNFKPSELIKECKKVNKHVAGTSKNSKPMDCYVCKDAKGINYEECFYGQASESNPKNYYIETSKAYKEPTQVQSYNFNRYKRYTVNDNGKDDPYEFLKKQSEKYYNNPDFESSYKQPKSYEDEYRFGPEHFQQGEEKSSSEQIADQLIKSGENCRRVDKDGMTCMVCENKKTGGNYEQCSYSNAPEEKKYAYSKQRKYNQEDEPTEETDSSEEQPVSNKKPQQFYKPETNKKQKYQQRSRTVRPSVNSRDSDSDEVERIKPVNTNRKASEYTVPKHFANIQVSTESAESEDEPDHDEYYYVLPSQSESKRDEQRQAADANGDDHEATEEEEPEAHYGYYGEESKKDVEEVLAEFAKKDRSKCKKAEKNGMTCYLCVDKKGLQHEECMYVSESRPQSKYQAYHAKQETDGREGAAPKQRNEENVEESKVKSVRTRTSRSEPRADEPKYPDFGESTTESVQPQRRRRPKKATNEKRVVTRESPENTKSRITRRNYSERLDDQPIEESKDQYRVSGEKGAFSHETEPVFSKKFGVSLPKFMLARSEGEKIYDEMVNFKS